VPLKTRRADEPSLNLTPMIDIVFLLIIFFMVGTKFTEAERNVPLEVPRVRDNGTLTAAPQRKIVNVYRDGSVTLDREVVSVPELEATLKAARRQYPQTGVLVRGDGQGAFDHVARVLVAVRAAGIEEMGISVDVSTRR